MARHDALWVVEVKFPEHGEWQSTTYVELTKDGARKLMREVQSISARGGDRYRVRRYVREVLR